MTLATTTSTYNRVRVIRMTFIIKGWLGARRQRAGSMQLIGIGSRVFGVLGLFLRVKKSTLQTSLLQNFHQVWNRTLSNKRLHHSDT